MSGLPRGRNGGRKPTCLCGKCGICKQRAYQQKRDNRLKIQYQKGELRNAKFDWDRTNGDREDWYAD